jgi:hypothetical protein
VCKTFLNIAEIQFSDGQGYDEVSKTYLCAYKHAKNAKHHLLEVSKKFKWNLSLAESNKTLMEVQIQTYFLGSTPMPVVLRNSSL